MKSDLARLAGNHQARVDSFGNAIVNVTPGLPDWAQRDVDALREAVANTLLHLGNLELALVNDAESIKQFPPRLNAATYARDEQNLATDRFETRRSLGNYLGQAIVRRIEFEDLISLDATAADEDVLDSLVSYLHFYENLKHRQVISLGSAYQPSVYGPEVIDLIAKSGFDLAQVLAIEGGAQGGIAGVDVCYNTFEFGQGWTQLSGDTVLWSGTNGTFDDLSADVPINLRTYFYPCQEPDPNINVRISTNGYITFVDQGGGTTDGTDPGNDSLPNTFDPDGFAAPWWDDLTVIAQGSTDEISYKTEGSPGNREFTVQYFSVSRDGGDVTDFHRFQVKLFENTIQVQFHYDTTWAADAVDNATTGLENFTGLEAHCAINCTNTNNAEPPFNYDFMIPPPANDLCANAECLQTDFSLSQNNYGATGNDVSTCVESDIADVWFQFHATGTSDVTISLCGGTNFDASLAVYDGCGGVQLACNDNFCGVFGPAQMTFAATAGSTYLIRVAGTNNNRGTFLITAEGGVSMGDDPSHCWPLVGAPDNFTGTTSNNSGCVDGFGCGPGDLIDEWFCWTAPVDGVAFATTCDAVTNFDTAISARTLPGANVIVCNDNVNAFGCTTQSRVQWLVEAGEQFYVRVAGVNGTTGNYRVTVGMSDCPADVAPNGVGNGVVNVDDLLFVINSWGPCPPVNCAADIAPVPGNNIVNVDDLLAVINNWGSC